MDENIYINPKLSKKTNKKYLNNLQKKQNNSTNTIPSIKDIKDSQSKNHSSKSFQMTYDDNNKIKSKSNSKPKSRNNSKLPSSLIYNNNESSLLKNIHFLDSENSKLREALKEINIELQEKEEELNESEKIIKKINNEYTQVLNQYKIIEEEKINLKKENIKLQKMCDNLNKKLNNKEKKEKQNEQIKGELIKTKEVLNNIKGNFNNASCDLNKIEKDMKLKEIIIHDLKIEGNKIVNMLQDRELLIKEYNKKISELNSIIKQKDEQLKLMLNFSKELNNENKTNIKEITKQAVKTINVFYNSKNSKIEQNKINLIEIKNNGEKNVDDENINDILSKNNCSILIKNAIKTDLYIPEIGTNYINKEFLQQNNLKTNLMKTEIFSNIFREFSFIEYLNHIFNKISEVLQNLNLEKNNGYMKNFKSFYQKIFNNLVKTKKENMVLKEKLNELSLYIIKLKKEFSNKNKKTREKIEKIINQYLSYISNLESIFKNNVNSDNINEKIEKISSKEISELNKEIDKINNINHNLKEEIMNKDDIINKLRNENKKLNHKLNSLRTNPNNAENNFKFYNSYSTKENCINPQFVIQKKDYNFQYGIDEDLKLNEDKVLNQNNNFDSFNNNESITNINPRYLTYNKKENKSFENIKEIKFNTINFGIENEDEANNLIKTNTNFNKNIFINLIIQNQDNFFINSNFSSLEIKNIKSLLKIIKDFTSEITEEYFIDMINNIFCSNNNILILNNKIGEIKNNLSQIIEKFKKNNKDKKIKPSQLIDILNELEKLLLYLFNQLSKYNFDSQNIYPFLKIIFNLVSLISYNNPLEINNNNIGEITPIDFNIDTLLNNTTSNYNNKFNQKKYLKDKLLTEKIINNKEGTELNNIYFNNLFYVNKKIFSSSELIKYYSIYEGLEISELISVFMELCDNFKNIIMNSKFNYESDISDLEENIDIERIKDNEIVTENNTYHVVNEKIFGLKKFEFNFKLFFELLKNYLVVFEIVVKQIELNFNNKENKIKLQKILSDLYNIFENSSYLNINTLDDNTIFCRKLLLTLLLYQKEYLSNFI